MHGKTTLDLMEPKYGFREIYYVSLKKVQIVDRERKSPLTKNDKWWIFISENLIICVHTNTPMMTIGEIVRALYHTNVLPVLVCWYKMVWSNIGMAGKISISL